MGRRAIIVAVERYALVDDGSIAVDLPGTVDRARRFRTWLSAKWDAEGIAEDARQIFFCSEPKIDDGRGASVKDLKNALDGLQRSGRDATDECYFYFSGHGFTFDRKRETMLIASDYQSMRLSGDCCANLDWIERWLTTYMGPGRHYYFIDACSNVLDADVIQPADALLPPPDERSTSGQPDTFLLQSSPPNETSPADNDFADALLDGLSGRGIAKTWDRHDPDAMVVRFDTLREFVKQRLARRIHQEVKGDGGETSGLIATIKPPPLSNCTIRLDGDGAGTVRFVGEKRRHALSFGGGVVRYDLPPDVYRISLDLRNRTASPREQRVELYDDAEAKFSIDEPSDVADEPQATVSVDVPPHTSLSLSGLDRTVLRTLQEGSHSDLPQGRYAAVLTDSHDRIIKSDELTLETPGAVSIASWAHSPVHAEIASRFPSGPNGEVWFSKSLRHAVADIDLDLWLAVIGAGKIIEGGPFQGLDEISRFPLTGFAAEKAGSSPVWVLCALRNASDEIQFSVDTFPEPAWVTAATSGIAHMRDMRASPAAGPLVVSMRREGQALKQTLNSFAFANRVTLITLTESEDGVLTAGQYFVPMGHLSSEFDYQTFSKNGHPLEDALNAAKLVRAFRQRRNVWRDLPDHLHGKMHAGDWPDPTAILTAAFDALRRKSDGSLAALVSELKTRFAGLPDTHVVEALSSGQRPSLAGGLPIFMDGFVAAGGSARDLPAGSMPDYASIWTAWQAPSAPKSGE